MNRIVSITMPKFGLSMTEGKVAAWLVEEGQPVKRGTEIADIETTKITNAFESPVEGVMRRRIADIGIDLPVGALIAVFADESVSDADIDSFVDQQRAEFAANSAATAASGAAQEPKKVAVGDGEIRYLETGNPDGSVAVLVHGFGGDLNNWLFTQPALAESHRVIAIDLPGHGGSSKNLSSGTIEELGRKLLDFMAALNIESAHLVGHSLGAAVIASAASLDASKVASLTLIAPAGVGSEINQGFIDGFIQADRRKTLQPVLAELFADSSLVSRSMVEDILRFKRLDGAIECLNRIAAANFKGGVQQSSIRNSLEKVKKPILAIWGDEDKIIPPRQADSLPSGVKLLRLKGVGHMPHLEGAIAVNEQLLGFLAAGK